MNNLNVPVIMNRGAYQIQNIDLLSLTTDYGSPLFLYDLDHIVARYQNLAKAIPWPRLRVYYAMKANYNLHILQTLKEVGSRIDAVSPAEIFFALKAGFAKENILYTANNLTDEEIRLVHNLGVLLNIDSLSGLKRYGEAFTGSDICLRFNSDVVAGEHEHIQTGGDKTKFGINLEETTEALEIVERYRLKVVGLHEHTGSGIAEAEQFYQGMSNLLSIASKERFPHLRFIDFGGGFKVPYHPDEKRINYVEFGRKATARFADFCRAYGRELELYFEPGKYIVAEGGILLMQVNTIKNNRGRLIAGTNSGFGHLIRPLLYNAYHHILNISNPNGAPHTYDICGNICETGDLFATGRTMPEIREGDTLAVLNAGAYGFSMASLYNLRSLPAEVVIRSGKAAISRQQISPEGLAGEIFSAYK